MVQTQGGTSFRNEISRFKNDILCLEEKLFTLKRLEECLTHLSPAVIDSDQDWATFFSLENEESFENKLCQFFFLSDMAQIPSKNSSCVISLHHPITLFNIATALTRSHTAAKLLGKTLIVFPTCEIASSLYSHLMHELPQVLRGVVSLSTNDTDISKETADFILSSEKQAAVILSLSLYDIDTVFIETVQEHNQSNVEKLCKSLQSRTSPDRIVKFFMLTDKHSASSYYKSLQESAILTPSPVRIIAIGSHYRLHINSVKYLILNKFFEGWFEGETPTTMAVSTSPAFDPEIPPNLLIDTEQNSLDIQLSHGDSRSFNQSNRARNNSGWRLEEGEVSREYSYSAPRGKVSRARRVNDWREDNSSSDSESISGSSESDETRERHYRREERDDQCGMRGEKESQEQQPLTWTTYAKDSGQQDRDFAASWGMTDDLAPVNGDLPPGMNLQEATAPALASPMQQKTEKSRGDMELIADNLANAKASPLKNKSITTSPGWDVISSNPHFNPAIQSVADPWGVMPVNSQEDPWGISTANKEYNKIPVSNENVASTSNESKWTPSASTPKKNKESITAITSNADTWNTSIGTANESKWGHVEKKKTDTWGVAANLSSKKQNPWGVPEATTTPNVWGSSPSIDENVWGQSTNVKPTGLKEAFGKKPLSTTPSDLPLASPEKINKKAPIVDSPAPSSLAKEEKDHSPKEDENDDSGFWGETVTDEMEDGFHRVQEEKNKMFGSVIIKPSKKKGALNNTAKEVTSSSLPTVSTESPLPKPTPTTSTPAKQTPAKKETFKKPSGNDIWGASAKSVWDNSAAESTDAWNAPVPTITPLNLAETKKVTKTKASKASVTESSGKAVGKESFILSSQPVKSVWGEAPVATEKPFNIAETKNVQRKKDSSQSLNLSSASQSDLIDENITKNSKIFNVSGTNEYGPWDEIEEAPASLGWSLKDALKISRNSRPNTAVPSAASSSSQKAVEATPVKIVVSNGAADSPKVEKKEETSPGTNEAKKVLENQSLVLEKLLASKNDDQFSRECYLLNTSTYESVLLKDDTVVTFDKTNPSNFVISNKNGYSRLEMLSVCKTVTMEMIKNVVIKNLDKCLIPQVIREERKGDDTCNFFFTCTCIDASKVFGNILHEEKKKWNNPKSIRIALVRPKKKNEWNYQVRCKIPLEKSPKIMMKKLLAVVGHLYSSSETMQPLSSPNSFSRQAAPALGEPKEVDTVNFGDMMKLLNVTTMYKNVMTESMRDVLKIVGERISLSSQEGYLNLDFTLSCPVDNVISSGQRTELHAQFQVVIEQYYHQYLILPITYMDRMPDYLSTMQKGEQHQVRVWLDEVKGIPCFFNRINDSTKPLTSTTIATDKFVIYVATDDIRDDMCQKTNDLYHRIYSHCEQIHVLTHFLIDYGRVKQTLLKRMKATDVFSMKNRSLNDLVMITDDTMLLRPNTSLSTETRKTVVTDCQYVLENVLSEVTCSFPLASKKKGGKTSKEAFTGCSVDKKELKGEECVICDKCQRPYHSSCISQYFLKNYSQDLSCLDCNAPLSIAFIIQMTLRNPQRLLNFLHLRTSMQVKHKFKRMMNVTLPAGGSGSLSGVEGAKHVFGHAMAIQKASTCRFTSCPNLLIEDENGENSHWIFCNSCRTNYAQLQTGQWLPFSLLPAKDQQRIQEIKYQDTITSFIDRKK